MRTRMSALTMGLTLSLGLWAAGINYNGSNLTLNTEFTRSQCGTASKNVMPEISGLACSRTTPGYLWAHGDENTGSNKKIIAIEPTGTLAMTVTISGDPGRDDWEDIATGVYDGKNYIFIGAFGDNDGKFKDAYYIYYFEEPAITPGTIDIAINYIRFGYPDGQAHNTETLLYDNIEHVFYIADKVKDGICTLYSLPFRMDYGTDVQTLTKVTELGNGKKFHTLTAGDITPDGHWMAIKSKKQILLWERQGNESLSTTVLRTPTQIDAYSEEAQGESLAWRDASTFYTTSDVKAKDGDALIYQYVRAVPTAVSLTQAPDSPARKIMVHDQVLIQRDTQRFDLLGRKR